MTDTTAATRATDAAIDEEALFDHIGRAGVITLNRPKAFNALTLDMVRRMTAQLAAWAHDDGIGHVILKAAPGKAFCSGGDIRNLHDWGRAGDARARAFFCEEYRLDRLIKVYPKPVVSLIDGVVMGGGVGISINGSHRVMTENTVFAMPEVGIGLFPDVGGTFFLPRLPGHVGSYLALTGDRIRRDDAVMIGLGTHAVAAETLDALFDDLTATSDPAGLLNDRAMTITESPLDTVRDRIDALFGGGSVAGIMADLDRAARDGDDWAARCHKTIATKSPTSLAIALRQMRIGGALAFDDGLKTEYRIVSRVLQGHDFFEGVRAVIVDKDNAPRWRPDTIAGVTDDMTDAYFAPLSDELSFEAP